MEKCQICHRAGRDVQPLEGRETIVLCDGCARMLLDALTVRIVLSDIAVETYID